MRFGFAASATAAVGLIAIRVPVDAVGTVAIAVAVTGVVASVMAGVAHGCVGLDAIGKIPRVLVAAEAFPRGRALGLWS